MEIFFLSDHCGMLPQRIITSCFLARDYARYRSMDVGPRQRSNSTDCQSQPLRCSCHGYPSGKTNVSKLNDTGIAKTYCDRFLTRKVGLALAICSCVCVVTTARVLQPAAWPLRIPFGASSNTMPLRYDHASVISR